MSGFWVEDNPDSKTYSVRDAHRGSRDALHQLGRAPDEPKNGTTYAAQLSSLTTVTKSVPPASAWAAGGRTVSRQVPMVWDRIASAST